MEQSKLLCFPSDILIFIWFCCFLVVFSKVFMWWSDYLCHYSLFVLCWPEIILLTSWTSCIFLNKKKQFSIADCVYSCEVTPLIFSSSTHRTAAWDMAHLVLYMNTHVRGHIIKNKCEICALCKYVDIPKCSHSKTSKHICRTVLELCFCWLYICSPDVQSRLSCR